MVVDNNDPKRNSLPIAIGVVGPGLIGKTLLSQLAEQVLCGASAISVAKSSHISVESQSCHSFKTYLQCLQRHCGQLVLGYHNRLEDCWRNGA